MSQPFRKLYDSARWKRRTLLQKQEHPLCERCELAGRTTLATLSHHIVPHNGDPFLFFFGKLQSLCLKCHLGMHGNSKHDFSQKIGADGWPVDPTHVVYQTNTAKRETQR
jgi:5-methylcytosine-specific restriction enzyme A